VASVSNLRLAFSAWAIRDLSVMVQSRRNYDPAEVAAQSFQTVVAAAREAGVPLEHHGARV
jgi:hypothetical protein